jgi:hypothetical protein
LQGLLNLLLNFHTSKPYKFINILPYLGNKPQNFCGLICYKSKIISLMGYTQQYH